MRLHAILVRMKIDLVVAEEKERKRKGVFRSTNPTRLPSGKERRSRAPKLVHLSCFNSSALVNGLSPPPISLCPPSVHHFSQNPHTLSRYVIPSSFYLAAFELHSIFIQAQSTQSSPTPSTVLSRSSRFDLSPLRSHSRRIAPTAHHTSTTHQTPSLTPYRHGNWWHCPAPRHG